MVLEQFKTCLYKLADLLFGSRAQTIWGREPHDAGGCSNNSRTSGIQPQQVRRKSTTPSLFDAGLPSVVFSRQAIAIRSDSLSTSAATDSATAVAAVCASSALLLGPNSGSSATASEARGKHPEVPRPLVENHLAATRQEDGKQKCENSTESTTRNQRIETEVVCSTRQCREAVLLR